MEFSIMHLAEILAAVVAVLGGQKGIQLIQLRMNGRRGNNPSSERRTCLLTAEDREFVRKCFEKQTKDFKEMLVDERDRTRYIVSEVLRNATRSDR